MLGVLALTSQLAEYDGLIAKPFLIDGDDTGVEMIVCRPNTSICHSPGGNWRPAPSLLTVYETYGLEVTEMFVEWLSLTCRHMIDGYIAGSLVLSQMLIPNDRDMPLPKLRSLLSSHLNKLEGQKPVASEPLIAPPCELPLELLAKIVDSTRVSKQIRRLVLEARRASPLADHELWMAEEQEMAGPTFRVPSSWGWISLYVSSTYDNQGRCVLSDRRAVVTIGTAPWSYELVSYPVSGLWQQAASRVCYSPRCHKTALEARGCSDVAGRMQQLYDNIRSCSDEEMYAWVVQLSSERIWEWKDRSYATLEELRRELYRLVDVAQGR